MVGASSSRSELGSDEENELTYGRYFPRLFSVDELVDDSTLLKTSGDTAEVVGGRFVVVIIEDDSGNK